MPPTRPTTAPPVRPGASSSPIGLHGTPKTLPQDHRGAGGGLISASFNPGDRPIHTGHPDDLIRYQHLSTTGDIDDIGDLPGSGVDADDLIFAGNPYTAGFIGQYRKSDGILP